MAKRRKDVGKTGTPRGVPTAEDPLVIRRRGRRRELFRFKTLLQAERSFERVSNLMAEREESEMERTSAKDGRAAVAQQRLECKVLGRPPDEWPKFPEMPPLRGISLALGGRVVSAINGFVVSRRFSDEFVAKAKVAELEEVVTSLMARLEQYRQRVAELEARQRH